LLVSIGKSRRSGELVELLSECHGRIRQFAELARETGQRRDLAAPDVIAACERVERYFVEALPLHVRDEEDSILPRLRGHSEALDQALSQMRLEHEQHEPVLAELLSACRAARQAPTDPACLLELSQVAERLSSAFLPHLEQEEALIFPALRELLTEAERASITSELRARRQSS
jgi:iron-sulfur cluster repair protein YtfE (RIC family)